MRRALVLGTALSGAGAVLLAAAPAQAQQVPARTSLTLTAPQLLPVPTRFHARQNETLPQDLTRLPADRFSAPSIVAPTGGIQIQRTPSWVQPVAGAPAPVADLTIAAPRAAAFAGGDVVVEKGDIATTGDDMPGVDTVATGTTTITTGNIATQGGNSGGVRAYGYGDMTIHAGDIHTQGYRADGINANTNVGGNSGGIEITAGNIETGGFAASGVRATAYNGSTAITVGSVKPACAPKLSSTDAARAGSSRVPISSRNLMRLSCGTCPMRNSSISDSHASSCTTAMPGSLSFRQVHSGT